MIFTETTLKGCYLVDINPLADSRGWFARTWCEKEFKKINVTKNWVQLNHSFTQKKGTVRGMHYQNPPFSEIKMVKCFSGSIYDVVIDLRQDSPTFLNWFGTELSAENNRMLLIPEGFAHGFQTLSDNCGLMYHHSSAYEPKAEAGLLHDDPLLNILWPLPVTCISEKDTSYDLLTNSFKGLKV